MRFEVPHHQTGIHRARSLNKKKIAKYQDQIWDVATFGKEMTNQSSKYKTYSSGKSTKLVQMDMVEDVFLLPVMLCEK